MADDRQGSSERDESSIKNREQASISSGIVNNSIEEQSTGTITANYDQSPLQDIDSEQRSNDEQREAALEYYFHRITRLLDKHAIFHKRETTLTRTYTLDILTRLDSKRKGSVVRFLLTVRLLTAAAPISILEDAPLQGAHLQEAHLQGVNLQRAHLQGANLDRVHLEGANLRETNLQGASLDRAHLRWAHLEEAHLEGAHLEGAHLEGAHLEEAHLEWAHLEWAHLEWAHLNGAYLNGAHLDHADLFRANLQGAKYTTKTQWPDGFEPQDHGAILVDEPDTLQRRT